MNTKTAKTVISVKTDKVTKEAAQEVAKSMGLNLSTLVNSYLKQVVYTRRVELFAPEEMTPKLEKAILASIKSGVSPRAYTSAKDFVDITPKLEKTLKRVMKEVSEDKDRKAFTSVDDWMEDLNN